MMTGRFDSGCELSGGRVRTPVPASHKVVCRRLSSADDVGVIGRRRYRGKGVPMFRHVMFCLGILAVGSVQAGEAEKFFTERVKDFGTVPFGQTQVHHFKVSNTSDKPVYLTGVGVSCGCVTATLQANTLRPGESTYVTASMDTKRFIGQKEVIVYVNFAQPH